VEGLSKDSEYKLPTAADKHREEITMLLRWQSVQKQLCKSVQAPQPLAHCNMKMPGHVTEVLTPLPELQPTAALGRTYEDKSTYKAAQQNDVSTSSPAIVVCRFLAGFWPPTHCGKHTRGRAGGQWLGGAPPSPQFCAFECGSDIFVIVCGAAGNSLGEYGEQMCHPH
jgi:hypothetical protein